MWLLQAIPENKTMNNIYWIGGSPCSGKSTVAQMISDRLGMDYFKLDDLLEELITRAAENGGESCAAVIAMTPEQTWMRDPKEQCREEFAIYREIFPYAMEKLTTAAAAAGRPVITEGAGWLPELMQNIGVERSRYFCLVPTRVFQMVEYSKRPWIDYVLEGCSDKEAAFANWMERDVQFALRAAADARRRGYPVMVNDGSPEIEDMYRKITGHFGFTQ